jgi:hypothetical protein
LWAILDPIQIKPWSNLIERVLPGGWCLASRRPRRSEIQIGHWTQRCSTSWLPGFLLVSVLLRFGVSARLRFVSSCSSLLQRCWAAPLAGWRLDASTRRADTAGGWTRVRDAPTRLAAGGRLLVSASAVPARLRFGATELLPGYSSPLRRCWAAPLAAGREYATRRCDTAGGRDAVCWACSVVLGLGRDRGCSPGSPGRRSAPGKKGSWLVSKVCTLCRVLVSGISVMLTAKSSLGILFD